MLMSAPEIAGLMRTDESHVRKVIHAFNEEGFSSLDPDYRGGRPADALVALEARASPGGDGHPVEREALRQQVIDAGLSHQRTRSWKWSPDPDFKEKAERVPRGFALLQYRPITSTLLQAHHLETFPLPTSRGVSSSSGSSTAHRPAASSLVASLVVDHQRLV
jgi:hypothetical protein